MVRTQCWEWVRGAQWVAHLAVLVSALLTGGALSAQSVNIDFGPAGSIPPATFGGAGLPGVWNGILGDELVQYTNFVDLEGGPTSITCTNIGGTDLLTTQVPLPPSERSLLSDYLVTYSTTLETCLFFHGLENGTYLVTTYAWHPQDDTVDSWVTVDQATSAGALVGGAWTGQLESGLQYSQHLAVVTSGDLYLHSGIPAGGSPAIACLNGLQLELIPEPAVEFIRADANQDGAIDLGDVTTSLDVLFSATPNGCTAALDANGDGAHDIGDPIAALSYLFIGGAAPPAPFPSCGTDPVGVLDCESFNGCP